MLYLVPSDARQLQDPWLHVSIPTFCFILIQAKHTNFSSLQRGRYAGKCVRSITAATYQQLDVLWTHLLERVSSVRSNRLRKVPHERSNLTINGFLLLFFMHYWHIKSRYVKQHTSHCPTSLPSLPHQVRMKTKRNWSMLFQFGSLSNSESCLFLKFVFSYPSPNSCRLLIYADLSPFTVHFWTAVEYIVGWVY